MGDRHCHDGVTWVSRIAPLPSMEFPGRSTSIDGRGPWSRGQLRAGCPQAESHVDNSAPSAAQSRFCRWAPVRWAWDVPPGSGGGLSVVPGEVSSSVRHVFRNGQHGDGSGQHAVRSGQHGTRRRRTRLPVCWPFRSLCRLLRLPCWPFPFSPCPLGLRLRPGALPRSFGCGTNPSSRQVRVRRRPRRPDP
jgi:hypothetical protein